MEGPSAIAPHPIASHSPSAASRTPEPVLRHLALTGLVGLVVAVASPSASSSAAASAAPTTVVRTNAVVGNDVDEIIGELRHLGDRVSVDTLAKLAKIGSPEALTGFELALDGGLLERPIARARAIRALSGFMKSRDLSGRVREWLANLAANADNSLEGIAAVETLGASGGIAREWLAKVVLSPAVGAVRVRALELHAEEFDDKDDQVFYRSLYIDYAKSRADIDPNTGGARPAYETDESLGKPLAGLAALAFENLAPEFEDAMLQRALDSTSRRVRTAAMIELADRGDKKMLKRAHSTFRSPSYAPAERAECAVVYGTAEGWEDVFESVQRASITTMMTDRGPQPLPAGELADNKAFLDTLGDLLAKRGSASFAAAAVKMGGDLQVPAARAFCARAIGRAPSKDAEKFLRELLDDEDLFVRVEALRTLTLRGTEGARKLIDRYRKSAESETERAILVELTSEMFGGDPDWVERLEKMCADDPSQMKNAALVSLARIGGNYEDLFDAALEADAPWGTQRAAVEALLHTRTKESTGKLVESLERLEGRIERAVMDALTELTGERFRNPTVWPRWWKDNQSGFQPLTEQEFKDLMAKREAAAEEASEGENKTVVGSFFGVDLDSERLTFLIDSSGSMEAPMAPRSGDRRGPTTGGDGDGRRAPRGGTRLEVAKNELLYFLGDLPPSALVNVGRFSDGADAWSNSLERVDKEKTKRSIRAFVEQLVPGGGTNIYAAMQLAFQDPDVDTIMLLSDGAPSVGEVLDTGTIAQHVGVWNAHRGVTIHVVCIGVDQPDLRRMAEDSGGSYTFLR